jgi:hypothetical protein
MCGEIFLMTIVAIVVYSILDASKESKDEKDNNSKET